MLPSGRHRLITQQAQEVPIEYSFDLPVPSRRSGSGSIVCLGSTREGILTGDRSCIRCKYERLLLLS